MNDPPMSVTFHLMALVFLPCIIFFSIHCPSGGCGKDESLFMQATDVRDP